MSSSEADVSDIGDELNDTEDVEGISEMGEPESAIESQGVTDFQSLQGHERVEAKDKDANSGQASDQEPCTSWADFFDNIDANRTASDLEYDVKEVDEEELSRQFHEKCFGQLSPISASLIDRSKDRGVAKFSSKMSVCFGICATDMSEPFELIQCEECSEVMKPVAYVHHQRLRHGERIEIYTEHGSEQEPDSDEGSEKNACHSFLLSPPHFSEDEPSTSYAGRLEVEEETESSTSSPLKKLKFASDVRKSSPPYYVEQRQDLKLVVKRSPRKPVTQEQNSDEAKDVVEEMDKPLQLGYRTSVRRKRKGQKKHNKSPDFEQSSLADPYAQSPSTVFGDTSSVADDLTGDKSSSAKKSKVDSPTDAFTIPQLPSPRIAKLEDVTQKVAGNGRRGRPKLKAPTSSTLDQAPSSVSSFLLPSVQCVTSSSSLRTELPITYDQKVDVGLTSNKHVYSHTSKKLYDFKAPESCPTLTSPLTTKFVPVSALGFSDPGLVCTSSQLTRPEFSVTNATAISKSDFMNIDTLNSNGLLRDEHSSYVLEEDMYSTNHQQYYKSIQKQFKPSRINSPTVLRKNNFSDGFLQQQSQVQVLRNFSSEENTGNAVTFFNETAATSRNGFNYYNSRGSSFCASLPCISQQQQKNLGDVGHHSHQDQMMMRAVQVIGAVSPTAIYKNKTGIQKRNCKHMEMNTNGNGEKQSSNISNANFACPAQPSLVKKFRPIVPRQSTVNNATMASVLEQRTGSYRPNNYGAYLTRTKPKTTSLHGIFRSQDVGFLQSSVASTSTDMAGLQRMHLAEDVKEGPCPQQKVFFKTANYYPIAQKRMINNSHHLVPAQNINRYGGAANAPSDDMTRLLGLSRFPNNNNNCNTGNNNKIVENGVAEFSELGTNYETASVLNERYGTRRIFSAEKVFISQASQFTHHSHAAVPLNRTDNFVKLRSSPSTSTSSQAFLNEKINAESNVNFQNIEPPPVLEAEGRISNAVVTTSQTSTQLRNCDAVRLNGPSPYQRQNLHHIQVIHRQPQPFQQQQQLHGIQHHQHDHFLHPQRFQILAHQMHDEDGYRGSSPAFPHHHHHPPPRRY